MLLIIFFLSSFAIAKSNSTCLHKPSSTGSVGTMLVIFQWDLSLTAFIVGFVVVLKCIVVGVAFA